MRTSLFSLLGALLVSFSSFAQAPEKMSYQAVIRDADNTLVTNQEIGMQISVLQNGTAVYEETQTPTSNTNGLVSLEIGTGTVISGSFASIDWSVNSSFIKNETDPTGGTNYTITSTSQLLSVPYAMYAKTSGSSTPGPQGPAGVNGEDGEDGAKGAKGDTGAIGAQGIQGIQGATGPQGPAGTNGTDGAKGDKGDTGAAGLTTSVNGVDQVNGEITLTTDAINQGNNNKYYSDALVSANSAVVANSAKVGITSNQATAITDNTAKKSMVLGTTATTALAGDTTIITSDQATAITANTAKVGYTEALVSANSVVVANTSKLTGTKIAIGSQAGKTTQGAYAVAMGYGAGNDEQGAYAVAMGYGAGQISQQSQAIAIGNLAGKRSQGQRAVAMGDSAGKTTQGEYAVAMGYLAGETSQGDYAVAIGNGAGSSSQPAKTIILNAATQSLNATGTQPGLYINSIRNDTGTNMLYYDPTSKEITYGTATSGRISKEETKNSTSEKELIQLINGLKRKIETLEKNQAKLLKALNEKEQ
jgi:hypothetical protein